MAKNTRRNTRRRVQQRKRGGACDISPAPVNATANELGLATQQSLAQGEQFAVLTRAYHGGKRRRGMTARKSRKAERKGRKAERKSRKAERKSRRNTRKGERKAERKAMKGGMAPMSIFGTEGVDVQRAMAHLAGQDMALNQAAAYSMTPEGQDNPFVPKVGPAQKAGARNMKTGSMTRTSRRTAQGSPRGGRPIYDGAPYTQTSSDMLLADDPARQAQAKQLESPTWKGVADGTYL